VKRVLVTGGSGFIGTNLILGLKEKGYEVVNLDRVESGLDVRNIVADITNPDFAFLDEEDFDYVVHLAALSSPQRCKDAKEAYEINVNGTLRFFEKLREKKLKKIVFMSSAVVYSASAVSPVAEDAPLDIKQSTYSYTKGMDEKICQDFIDRHGLPILTFRLSNIYGPYQQWKELPTLVPQIISQAILQKRIEVWNREPVRDWIYVGDVVEAVIAGLESGYVGVMNLASGVGAPVGEVVGIVAGLSGAEVKDLNKEVSGQKKLVCDISRISRELGWRPKTSLKEGLEKTYDYYLKVILEPRHI
jgi:nucleoside-diphosphate-sugar epimerase